MSRTADNATVCSLVVTATLRVCRHMDRGNAKRTRVYVFPLSADVIGSKALHGLPAELAQMGGEIIAKAQSWEGGPRTPERAITDPLTRALQQQADAPSQMTQLIHAAAQTPLLVAP
jgi:hypothetical protein